MALGLDKVKNPVICGSLKMYEGTENNQHVIELPVKLDSRFVIGPEAAHLNISGISGLAAKTSYAMFLIKALQERVMQNDERIAFIIFNVKGKDLLAIDEPNDFEGKEMTKKTTFETYKKLGLTTKPFKNVQYLYPISQNSDTYCPNSYIDTETFNKQMSLKKTSYYRFEYAQDKDCLELLFADVDDPTQTMESILSTILSGDNNFSSVNSWDELTKQLEMIREGKQPYTNKEISILSWRKFFRYYKKAINANRGLFAEHLKTGQIRIKDKIEQLAPGNMLVIDIARLDSEMQAFVFGATMKYLAEYQLTEKEKGKPEKFIIFIDELNKFASNDAPKGSPILHQILDITERGRSLGLILFGAEQFKSALHTRVTGNCSTFIYGKTNSIELTKADYHYVPSVYKTLMTRLKPGQYIIQNSTLNSLLRISCPLPVYKQFKS